VLKELSLPESFGLERRVERYQGKRPIGLYRWDLECLLDTLSLETTDRPLHPRPSVRDLAALPSLYDRLRKEYEVAYGPASPQIEVDGLTRESQSRCLASETNG
jgi:hypothetical protein